MGKKKMVANRVIKSNKTSTIDFSNIEKSNRRTILTTLVSTGLLLKVDPSLSSYGDSANVFGKTTNKSGFLALLERDSLSFFLQNGILRKSEIFLTLPYVMKTTLTPSI